MALLLQDSRDPWGLEEVALICTSPPYNAGIVYADGVRDDMPLAEYYDLLLHTFQQGYQVAAAGARLCVNIANIGRKPYRLNTNGCWRAMKLAGWMPRAEVIWSKGASVGVSTGWGSWRSPSAPSFRDVHEYILVASKGATALVNTTGMDSDLTAAEFTSWTKSCWEFPAARARKARHPAPFPEELPRRLIKLFTWPGQLVVDPFAGSGTTLRVATALGRRAVGFDLSPTYVAQYQE